MPDIDGTGRLNCGTACKGAGENTILRPDTSVSPAREGPSASPDSVKTLAPAPSSFNCLPSFVAPTSEERYTFTSIHAAGGIGRIWLARDKQLDRDVAIKELLPENAGDVTTVARFMREARLTGQLEHPSIVPVYELASREDAYFYAMKFVHGRTLTAAARSYHVKRKEGQPDPLEFAALLTAFAAVCNAVAYAHSRGVLHRDLKGDNVILGDFGEVIVLDWGLAKVMGQTDDSETEQAQLPSENAQDAGLTLQGEIVGTPAYMAPEQAEGRLNEIDRRTDVFGLGAIFYEILTGVPPFVGSNSLEVLKRAIRGDPALPHDLWPEVPAGLQDICLKAMAKRPQERYSSAIDLAQDVLRWQDVQRRQAEEALRASEEQYRSLADLIPGVVWTAAADGSINYANQYWLDFTGMTLEQTLGSGWATAIHPDDVDKVLRVWTKALETGELVEIDYRLRRADGEYRPFLARGRALRDREGRVVKWFGMLTELQQSGS
jgi:serine/threonine-protein kinase